MAVEVSDYFSVLRLTKSVPTREMWSSYDEEADVLYINFKTPARADDSELTDDDVIIRFEGDDIIGLTILRASKRAGALP